MKKRKRIKKNKQNKISKLFSSLKSFFNKKKSRPHSILKKKKIIEIDDDKIGNIVVDKNDKFNLVEVMLIVLVTVLFGMVVGYALSFTKSPGVEVSDEVQELVSTYENILENYYGEITEKELLDAAISGMIGELNDPYSAVMTGDNAEIFNDTVDGSFIGIGIVVEWNDNKFKITQVYENSPADKVKLQVNDYLTKINDEKLDGLTLNELSLKIKNKNQVKMTILRGEEELDVMVKPDVVEVMSVNSRIVDDNIGLIKINSFASNTGEQFEKQLKKLETKKINSLIIDVRGNPGGRLGEVNEIMDLFLDKKNVIYQIETKSKKEKIYTKDSIKRKYPIVVLVDYDTASAAEILTASFKDNYKKATIIGTVTYGKGTIQKAVNLSSGSTIKYTTQKWLTPKGVWINEVGLIPDVLLEAGDEYDNSPSDDHDLQLQKAIEILN